MMDCIETTSETRSTTTRMQTILSGAEHTSATASLCCVDVQPHPDIDASLAAGIGAGQSLEIAGRRADVIRIIFRIRQCV